MLAKYLLYKELLNTIGRMIDISNEYQRGDKLDIKDIEDLRRYSEIVKNLTLAIESDIHDV